MEQTESTKSTLLHDNFFIAGPLNLDLHKEQTSTTYGSKIPLTKSQFQMLLFLAINEEEAFAPKAIFDAAYDGAYDEAEARAQLDELISKTNEVGLDFMHITDAPDGYSFKTKWGRDWQIDAHAAKEKQTVFDIKTATPKSRKHRRIYAVVTAVAAAGIVMVLTFAMPPGQDFVHLENPAVPLATFGLSDTVLPAIGNIIADVYAEIALYNPIENDHWLSFEIILANTGQIIYTTDFFAPGTAANAYVPAKDLLPGDNDMILNIRVHSFPGLETVEAIRKEFSITVNEQLP